MRILNPGFKNGYTPITKRDGPTLMDFGILRLKQNEEYEIQKGLETALLLMNGSAELKYENDKEIKSIKVHRESIYDDNPTTLLVSSNTSITIISKESNCEWAIIQTENEIQYEPRFFSPKDTLTEQFGLGTLRETSTRDVRTIFDKNNMPESNLVLGEVINYPGKWSSYPPHGHDQPEIYHYRFLPEQGFGFGMDGFDSVKILHNGDTLLILNGAPHSQTAAPGYAMYYIWAIRHLDGNPYGPKDPRKFLSEHTWVMDPKNNDRIWPYPAKKILL